MNNNSDKTFADLFLGAKNEDVKDNNMTFDILSNNVSDSDATNIKSDTEANENNSVVSFNSVFSGNNDVSNDNVVDSTTFISSNDGIDSLSEKSVFDMAVSEIDGVVKLNNEEKEQFISEHNENNNLSFNGFNVDNFNKSDEGNSELVTGVNLETNISANIENNISNSISNDTNHDENNSQIDDSNIVNDMQQLSSNISDTDDLGNIGKIEVVLDEKVDITSNGSDNELVTDNHVEQLSTNVFGIGDVNDSSDNRKNDSNEVKKEELNVLDKVNDDDVSNKENSKVDSKDLEESGNPFLASNGEFVIDGPLFSDVISLEKSNNKTKKASKIDLDNTKHFEVKVVQKKEPLIKFVIGVISYAFFILLLLIGITLLVYVVDIKVRAAKGDYSPPKFNAYVVLTGSMLPAIQVNDVVVTKKVDTNELEVGDIITFASTDSRFAGTIITHRIIKKNPAKDGRGVTFQTRGDNNNVADSALVESNNIYGKVILKIPKLGYLQEFLASDGGWIIVILIPCLTVISYDIVKLIKGLKRKKYNNIKVKK